MLAPPLLFQLKDGMSIPVKDLEWLLVRMQMAQSLAQAHPDEAASFLRELLGDALARGIDSPAVHFRLGLSLDDLGDEEGAFREFVRAIALDPLCLHQREQLRDCARRLRSRLAWHARQGNGADVARIHSLLSEAGEADVQCHLALARHHVSGDRLVAARELVEAVTRLFPGHTEGWLLLAEIARAEGALDVALRAEIRAATIVFGPMPEAEA